MLLLWVFLVTTFVLQHAGRFFFEGIRHKYDGIGYLSFLLGDVYFIEWKFGLGIFAWLVWKIQDL